MSESRVFKVPEDLHENVESRYMEFVMKNPVLSMGADGRRNELRVHSVHAVIRQVLETAAAAPDYAEGLGFDPDDETVFRRLQPYSVAHGFLRLVRGWPRSMAERAAFARKVKYSNFVAQCMRQGLGIKGAFDAAYDEGTDGWDPATAKTIARKAFL